MHFPESDKIRWKVLGQQSVYRNDRMSVWHARVQLPDGSVIEDHYCLDYVRPAVGIVAIDERRNVLLVDHDRFVSGERGWEIPGGGVDAGEAPEDGARRELREEAGGVCGEIVRLADYLPTIGNSNQRFFICLGNNARKAQTQTDTNEIAESRWFSTDQVRELIKRNQIRDGLSLTGLLLAIFEGHL